MNQFRVISRQDLQSLLSVRPGEVKLGEHVHTLDPLLWREQLQLHAAPFVLLGIPEDIGVRANYGIAGTAGLWLPALKAILNVQETNCLSGRQLVVLGAFDFTELSRRAIGKDAIDLRDLVCEIDDIVFPVIKAIRDAGKIAIVIGGGHNNCYPLLKGMSLSMGKPLNCINLDAHTDYRSIEGRHSGNGFRYAKIDGYLKRYAVVGLHKNYNSQNVLSEMQSDPDLHTSFYEDLFVLEKNDFRNAIDEAVRFTAGAPTGIELDLDCIEHTLSSAASPCGISPLLARRSLTQLVQFAYVAYLHIAEGGIEMSDGRNDIMTAKLVSYLITDFMRAAANRPTVF